MIEKGKIFFDKHGITASQIERLLETALSRGGDFADLYFERRTQESLLLEEGILKTATRNNWQGVGVRVISGEKSGCASSDDLEFGKMAEAARAAAHIAAGSGRGVAAPRSGSTGHNLYALERPLIELEIEGKLRMLREADEAARRYDPRIREVRAALVSEYKAIMIANSEGLLAADIQPLVRFQVTCIARADGNQQVGSYGGGGRVGADFFIEHPPSYYAREAARQAVLQLEADEAPAGIMEVVLASGWPGVLLHEAVGHGLEADFNRKGISVYSGRIGERVASELCTVVDDGSIPFRRGSLNFDDEGTPTRRTILIEKGILKGYLYDLLSARLMGAEPTGNGRRESYSALPIPRMTNTFLLGGAHSPEEIIATVKRGLYAVNFNGGQVDITSGKFVFSASEAYLIEAGKVGRPVKGATLIGNGPEILTKVVMVGNDLRLDEGVGTCGKDGQSVPVGVGMPTVKLSEMTVGGTRSN